MSEPSSERPLAGRLALVTGASRGIGRAAAEALAGAGAHVIALARTQGGLEELDDAILAATGMRATLVPLDLADYDGIDRLGSAIAERWGKLDILVGNAGVIGPLTPLAHVTPQVWQQMMDVNVTANWRLIRSLDPLLRRSDAGRVIFITSGAALKARAYWGPYSVSKAALNTLARTYAAEAKSTLVKVMLVNPGPLRTAMRRAAMPGEDPTTLKTPEELAPIFVRLAGPGWFETGKLYDYPSDCIVELGTAA